MLTKQQLQDVLKSMIDAQLCNVAQLTEAIPHGYETMGRNRGSKITYQLPMNLYQNNGYYRYKHPQTGKFHNVGKDRQQAIQDAHKLNGELISGSDYVKKILGQKVPKFARFVDKFDQQIIPTLNLATNTEKEYRRKFPHIKQHLGNKPIDKISVADVAEFIDNFPPTQSNRYRSLLSNLFSQAIARGLCEHNPAAVTLKKKENVQRKRFTQQQYDACYQHAEPWLKNAMDLAYYTVQRRVDLVALKWSQIRDGYIWITQIKIGNHVKIKITPSIQAVLDKCRDNIPSEHVIHRIPEKMVKAKGRTDPYAVLPDMVSKNFFKARQATKLFTDYPPRTAPTFSEIRSFGAKCYQDAGIDEKTIQFLLGHSTEAMTGLYLDRYEVEWVEVDINQGDKSDN